MIEQLHANKHCRPISLGKGCLCLWLGLLLVACKATTDRDLAEFFGNDSSCRPPCWHGITPGITSESDALSIIANPAISDPESHSVRSYDSPSTLWYLFELNQGTSAGVMVSHGLVGMIELRPDFRLKLGNLIDRVGEPDFVYVEDSVGGEIYYIVELYYLGEGIMARFFSDPERDVPPGYTSLTGTTEIETISLFKPADSLEEALENSRSLDPTTALVHAVKWDGFGYYQGS